MRTLLLTVLLVTGGSAVNADDADAQAALALAAARRTNKTQQTLPTDPAPHPLPQYEWRQFGNRLYLVPVQPPPNAPFCPLPNR